MFQLREATVRWGYFRVGGRLKYMKSQIMIFGEFFLMNALASYLL
jgi:hypothetical protein